jgi:hypothetical protein
MITLRLQINHNMATQHPDKLPDQRYRMTLARLPRPAVPQPSSLFFYFTREELYEFANNLVDLVSKLPTLEQDPTLTGLQSVIDPDSLVNDTVATSAGNPVKP